MFLRQSFKAFAELSSDAASLPAAPRDWVLDWRWFGEA
jgi:hypothetical protein